MQSWICSSRPGPRATRTRSGSGKRDRKSTRLNSSHPSISYAVFSLKKKKLYVVDRGKPAADGKTFDITIFVDDPGSLTTACITVQPCRPVPIGVRLRDAGHYNND